MGSKTGVLKAHQKLKDDLGEEAYLQELKKRASKGGSVKSDAKRLAALAREQKKREARADTATV